MIINNQIYENISKPTYKQLYTVLHLLYIPWLIKLIFHPFIDIYHELQCIILDRHVEKSFLKICTICVLSATSVLLFNANYLGSIALTEMLHSFRFTPLSSIMLSELTTLLIVGHLVCYLSESIAKIACYYFYQDHEFYTTSKKINQLKEKLHKQGYTHFTNEEVLHLIDFCKSNLRKRSFTGFFSDKAIDWKKNLEAIIYDADVEPFLDQQQALKIKLNTIKKTRHALNNYLNQQSYSLSSSCLSSLPNDIMQTIAMDAVKNHEINSMKPDLIKKSKHLLVSSTLTNNLSPEKIARLELNKTTLKYLTQNSRQLSAEDLIYNCKYELNSRCLDTSSALVPEHIMSALASEEKSFTLFIPLYTYLTPLQPMTDHLTETYETREQLEPPKNHRKSSIVTFVEHDKPNARL